MSNLFTDPSYTGKCPKCGDSFEKKLGGLEGNTQFPCPGCGAAIIVDQAEIQKGLDANRAAAEALDKLPPWMRRGQ